MSDHQATATKRPRIGRIVHDDRGMRGGKRGGGKRRVLSPVAAVSGAAEAEAEAEAAAPGPPSVDGSDRMDEMTRALIAAIMQADELDTGGYASPAAAPVPAPDMDDAGRSELHGTSADRARLAVEQDAAYHRAEEQDRARMAAKKAVEATAEATAEAAARWCARVSAGARRLVEEVAGMGCASAEAAAEALLAGGGTALPHAPHALLLLLRAEFPEAAATLVDPRGNLDHVLVRNTAAIARDALQLQPAMVASMSLALASILLSARIMLAK